MRTQALKPSLKLLTRIAGWALSLTALAFFVRLVVRNGADIPGRGVGEIAAVSAISAVLYGLAVALLGLLWPLLATPPGHDGEPLAKPLTAGYMKSQFAKYLPGNVFQYLARHALGRQLGIAHGHLASAALAEAILLVCAAGFITVLFGGTMLRVLLPAMPSVPWPFAFSIPLVIALAASTPRPRFLNGIPRYRLTKVLLAFAGYVLFFTVFGALFFGLLAWSSGIWPDPLRVIPSSVLAWLVGFLVPGAPAGAGLREAALALGAGSGSPAQATLAAIMLFRLATMGGDFLAFTLGWALSRGSFSQRHPPSDS